MKEIHFKFDVSIMEILGNSKEDMYEIRLGVKDSIVSIYCMNEKSFIENLKKCGFSKSDIDRFLRGTR